MLQWLHSELEDAFQTWSETIESDVPFCFEVATLKSTSKAVELRLRGNSVYGDGVNREAIRLYSESIAFASDGSEELALAYGNRSAVNIREGKLIACLLDINRALKGKYPEGSRVKLQRRKEKCLNRMRASSEPSYTNYEGNETDQLDAKDAEDDLLDRMCKFGNSLIPHASPKIKLECDEQWGRYLVATKDIEPGEILSRQEFFMTKVMEPSLLFENCSHCLARCHALIPCSSCIVMYCSTKCLSQAEDMYHRMECKMSRMIGQKCFQDFANTAWFVALRALFIGTKQGTELQSLMDKLDMGDIFAEKTDPRNAPFINDYETMLRMSRTFDSVATLDTVDKMALLETIVIARRAGFFDHSTNTSENGLNEVELYTAMLLLNHIETLRKCTFQITHLTDSLSVNPDSEKVVALGLNIFHNFVNHSCDPNVLAVSRNREQLLYTVQAIKKGEQLFFPYAGKFADDSLEKRRSLQKLYNFVCQCKACIDDWPGFENNLEKLKIEFFDKSLALVDDQRNLKPIFMRIFRHGGGISDLSNHEILQSICKILKWMQIHLKKPSAVFVTCGSQLSKLMNLLFNKSYQEYTSASDIERIFSVVVDQFLNKVRVLLEPLHK